MYSHFLPSNFNPELPIAVIAGQGQYPQLLVEAIHRFQLPVKLIAFEEETPLKLIESFPLQNRALLKVGQLGKMLKALQTLQAGYVLMAGQITPKRLFKGLYPDLKALSILARLKERNAMTIFGAIVTEIEALSIPVLDARAFLDDHLASEGLMTGGKLKTPLSLIERGVQIAKEVARLNIGQSIVISGTGGTILAVEAFEGTNAMIERGGSFGASLPILIKTVKPAQDYRFDVPVFGEITLQTMIHSGVKMAALEAENTLLLNKREVIAQAKKNNIQLFGYKSP